MAERDNTGQVRLSLHSPTQVAHGGFSFSIHCTLMQKPRTGEAPKRWPSINGLDGGAGGAGTPWDILLVIAVVVLL